MKNRQKIEQFAGIAFIAAIAIGCGFVLKPFLADVLWAAILCFSTWPLRALLLKWFGGRKTIVAVVMTIILLLVLFVPFLVIGLTFADSIRSAMAWLNSLRETGMPALPEWILKIPLAGAKINHYWTSLAENKESIAKWLMPHLQDVGMWFLRHSIDFGRGVFHLAVSILAAFFLYRDGEGFAEGLGSGIQRISGDYAQHLIEVVKTTVRTVVYGAIGTGFVQAVVAWIGFVIAGIPSAMLLALFTFFLSFIPLGPPLIWIGASIWLFAGGSNGWGIFMILYGALGISSVDNVIKPYLISRGTKLPFIVMFIGILGGIGTFGVVGVFLGPVLLAVGYSLTQELVSHRRNHRNSN